MKKRQPTDSKPIYHYSVPLGVAYKYDDGWRFTPLASSKYYQKVKYLQDYVYPEFDYLDVMFDGCLHDTEEERQAWQEWEQENEEIKKEMMAKYGEE